MASQEDVAVVRGQFEASERRDLEAVMASYHEDVVRIVHDGKVARVELFGSERDALRVEGGCDRAVTAVRTMPARADPSLVTRAGPATPGVGYCTP